MSTSRKINEMEQQSGLPTMSTSISANKMEQQSGLPKMSTSISMDEMDEQQNGLPTMSTSISMNEIDEQQSGLPKMSTSISMNEMDEQQNGLPEQIIMDEILARVPAKSVGRFKSVAKSWNAVISSAQFAKAHLQKQSNYPSSHLFFLENGYKGYWLSIEDEDLKGKEEPSLEDNRHDLIHFSFQYIFINHHKRRKAEPVGSSGGLVCLFVRDGQFLQFNPCLPDQIRTLPKPIPSVIDWDDSIIFCGFGYASSIGDFKVILGLSMQTESGGQKVARIYVFSMKNNSWRIVEEEGSQFDIIANNKVLENKKGMFVNERLHWLITRTDTDMDGRLFAFDLVHDVFEDIPTPQVLSSRFYKGRSEWSWRGPFGLAVMGGCLCFSIYQRPPPNYFSTDVWMLKQYRERPDSWVQINNIRLPECLIYHGPDAIGFTKTGKFLMQWSVSSGTDPDLHAIMLIDPNRSLPSFHFKFIADTYLSSMFTHREFCIPFRLRYISRDKAKN